jgi:O-antigen biosynthesis protein
VPLGVNAEGQSLIVEQDSQAHELEVKRLRTRLEELTRRCEDLEQRLLDIENSRFFRILRWPGRVLNNWRGRVGKALLHSPLHPVYLKLARPAAAIDQYQLWIEQENASVPEAECFRERRPQSNRTPLISIVMPVHNPRLEWLHDAVGSVLAQSYGCWELCVCDDASNNGQVVEFLSQTAATDPRIRFVRSEENLGIAGASNRAAELARGEYVGFLDQDDLLAAHALYFVAAAAQEGDPDLIYSDEDRLGPDSRRREPIFKPAWSPDLLLNCMYLGHFLVVKRSRLEALAGLRPAFDGSQDYDLALRITDNGATVRHIPRVLYHWRKHADSTATSTGAKPYTHEAGKKALAEAMCRRRWEAQVEDGAAPNTYRVRRQMLLPPKVSIVIVSRKAKLLAHCLREIEKVTTYQNREIVVVEHRTGDRRMEQVLSLAACTHVGYAGQFNFSRMNNLGADQAIGEVLVFLNDDTAPLVPDWLERLVSQAGREEVGVVGARLVYPSGAIQHAGMAIGIMSGTGHPCRETFGSAWWPWLPFSRNVSAVTGACMAIRKAVFQQLGGFDPAFPINYNDADLCLRARSAGYEVIYEAAALLRHFECRTRTPGIRHAERERWQRRWAEWLGRGDPYYSPHLTVDAENASLRLNEPPVSDSFR